MRTCFNRPYKEVVFLQDHAEALDDDGRVAEHILGEWTWDLVLYEDQEGTILATTDDEGVAARWVETGRLTP